MSTRADPEAGVRPVLDVDRERDRREQRPDARARASTKKSSRKPATPSGASCLRGAAGQSRRRVTRVLPLGRYARKDVPERVGEDVVLLRACRP